MVPLVLIVIVHHLINMLSMRMFLRFQIDLCKDVVDWLDNDDDRYPHILIVIIEL